MTVSDHRASEFGIQWQRYDADAPYPDLVKTVAIRSVKSVLFGLHMPVMTAICGPSKLVQRVLRQALGILTARRSGSAPT
jgi:hypothetical protein